MHDINIMANGWGLTLGCKPIVSFRDVPNDCRCSLCTGVPAPAPRGAISADPAGPPAV
jgi:hypothetical protein